MLKINKKFIVDENNKKVAVQLDIKTFEKMERILEDFALAELMNENKDSDKLSIEDAKKFYDSLEKVN